MSCYDCPFPVLEIPRAGIYTIEISNDVGCKDIQQIQISLLKIDVYVPNVISKSSMNFANQNLIAQSKKDIPYTLQVYDKWGNQIFEDKNLTTNDFSQGWNPSEYNPGIFVYAVSYTHLTLPTILLV